MSSAPTELERQVWELTRRVWTIEQRLGIRSTPVPAAPPAEPRTDAAGAGPVQTAPPVVAPPIVAPPVPAPPEMAPPVAARPVGPTVSASRPGPGASVASEVSFERFVGGKIYAALGAVVLVVGVALGLKLGIDRGWFTLPPAARCIAAALFGLAMIVAGRWAGKRWGGWAGVGLSGAGVACLFASALAAHAWYGLVGVPGALALLGVAGAIGIGVALSASSLAVAALALVGVYITPLAVGGVELRGQITPAYLIVALLVALSLSVWRPRVFRALRTLGWWGTVLLGWGWVLGAGAEHLWAAAGMLATVWLAVHAELWLGSTRLSESASTQAGPWRPEVRLLRPALASATTTAWCVGLGVWVLDEVGSPGMPSWLAPCAALVGTLALGMVLAGTLRAMQDLPQTDAERLGAGLRVQAGGLAIVALALGLSGWTVSLAWLGMGLAAALAGRWLRLRGMDVYAAVVLGLATLRIAAFDGWGVGGGTVDVMGLVLGRFTALMVGAGAAWIIVACVWGLGRERSVTRARLIGVALGLAAACLGGSLLMPGTDGRIVVLAWTLLGVAYALTARAWRGVGLEWLALGGLTFVTLAWGVVFIAQESWGGRGGGWAGGVMSHPGLWIGLLLSAAVAAVGPMAGRGRAWPGAAWGVGAALLLTLTATSLEVARSAALLVPGDTTVHRAAVSVWWGVFGVGLIVLGFATRAALVRHAGLALLGVATLKAVAFDLAGVSAEWRVASLLGLGVLMLGVSLGYARLAARAGAGASGPLPTRAGPPGAGHG